MKRGGSKGGEWEKVGKWRKNSRSGKWREEKIERHRCILNPISDDDPE